MTTLTIHHTFADHTTPVPPAILDEENPLLTLRESMSYLRVGRSTLYRMMWSGALTGYKVGTGWRFYRSDLQRVIQRQTFVQSA